MRSAKKKSNQAGQFVIEAVLILFLSVMLFTALVKSFKDKEIIENILTKPWSKIAGMLENGAWGDPAATRAIHPNNHENVATLKQNGI
ncbi:MAG: hypothetical protein L6Q37_11785 [Bdellovibrionaceae bacterium]|jgi:hypothetical protein|nr:hypothetical protein [Pseudobdellovibrionaceae bacterium]NUM59065.1 hypothetical protein [Pseudobdellovibrionaceae bacterium]